MQIGVPSLLQPGASLGGVSIPAWVLQTFGTPVLDEDFTNSKFFFNRQSYASEALLNTAAGATKSGNARTFGPYLPDPATNAMVNGDFLNDVAGWTAANSATLSVVAGQGVMQGNSGTNPQIYNATATVAGQAYKFTGSRKGGTSTAVIAAPNSNFNPLQTFVGGDVQATLTPSSAVVSASAATMYFGGRAPGAGISGASTFDDFSVVPCQPMNGMAQGASAAQITATTPSSAAGTQVLFESGDQSGFNRIRLAWGADTHLHYLIYFGSSTVVFDMDLGAIATSTQFTVLIGAGVDTFWYSLNGGARVYAASVGSMPGLGMLWFGRSNSGETWLGSIARVTVWPTALAAAPYLVRYGDSLVFGTGATIFPTDTWGYKLAGFLGRRDSNQGVGGESSTNIANRFQLGINNVGVSHPEMMVQNVGGWGDPRTLYILEGGYNNISNVAGTIEADFKRESDILDAVGARYIVMGPPTADVAALYIGGANRSKYDTVCANLLSYYGSRYVDVDGALKAQSTHTGQDATDDANGVVPASQRATGDAVHWSNAGHLTVFNATKSKIQALGWG
ncbi:SGNH/GDSL hydrolase family protein [Bradyrhizobium sp. CAR08]